jgi:hypothetical protein
LTQIALELLKSVVLLDFHHEVREGATPIS